MTVWRFKEWLKSWINDTFLDLTAEFFTTGPAIQLFGEPDRWVVSIILINWSVHKNTQEDIVSLKVLGKTT